MHRGWTKEEIYTGPEYLIIPALLPSKNNADEIPNQDKSLKDTYIEYHRKYNYKICYKFEADSCLASAGLMDLFLVQMYTNISTRVL